MAIGQYVQQVRKVSDIWKIRRTMADVKLNPCFVSFDGGDNLDFLPIVTKF